MWKLSDGTFRNNPPARVELDGLVRRFADLTLEERDAAGFNEAVPLEREPFTRYRTRWVKGGDLVYREEIVEAVVDETARATHAATAARAERDRLLAASDWTQLGDVPVDGPAWAAYRQALRDLPQQGEFPFSVTWPSAPA